MLVLDKCTSNFFSKCRFVQAQTFQGDAYTMKFIQLDIYDIFTKMGG